jgi:inosine-uridine nucleoside N-ribohydrolase
LGGTYLGHGNTTRMCSEFNFYKDPDAVKIVFDSFKDITLVPIEVPYTFKAID